MKLVEAPPPPKEDKKIVEEEPTYFVAVEEMPEPIGGIQAIQSKIVYPEIAKRAGVEGKVYVLAFVNEQGIVTKAEILKGLGAGLDEAALGAVKQTKFKPGKQRGKPVKVQVSIPIVFQTAIVFLGLFLIQFLMNFEQLSFSYLSALSKLFSLFKCI
ncbi:MAG: energy transducer TonB [Ignavibacteriales bacterium]|nr:energy transducer TonB [Ignavibacteriales bacterium]